MSDFIKAIGFAFDDGERIVALRPEEHSLRVTYSYRMIVKRKIDLVNGTSVYEDATEWQTRFEYIPYSDEARIKVAQERAANGE